MSSYGIELIQFGPITPIVAEAKESKLIRYLTHSALGKAGVEFSVSNVA